MKFRLWSLLWVIALFASAIATFGLPGILIALGCVSIWYNIFNYPETTLVEWLNPVSCLGIFVTLLPFVIMPQKPAFSLLVLAIVSLLPALKMKLFRLNRVEAGSSSEKPPAIKSDRGY